MGDDVLQQVSTADGTDTSTRKAQPPDRRKKKTVRSRYPQSQPKAIETIKE
jgi:hypothetical protein